MTDIWLNFTDYVSYVVIDESGNISKYNLKNNIKNLPYLINCEGPDEFNTKVFSLTKKEVLLPAKLKAKNFLVNGTIKNINQLNHFNQTPIACNITENKLELVNQLTNVFSKSCNSQTCWLKLDIVKRDHTNEKFIDKKA